MKQRTHWDETGVETQAIVKVTDGVDRACAMVTVDADLDLSYQIFQYLIKYFNILSIHSIFHIFIHSISYLFNVMIIVCSL